MFATVSYIWLYENGYCCHYDKHSACISGCNIEPQNHTAEIQKMKDALFKSFPYGKPCKHWSKRRLWHRSEYYTGDAAHIANPTAKPLNTISYQVIIRQGNCFTDTGNVIITVYKQPTVDAGTDQTILEGTSATLIATGTDIERYEWTPANGLSCTDCAQPIASPVRTTTYIITGYNHFCKATDDVVINVGCEQSIFMPNTFTPNGDGLNDRLFPQRKSSSLIKSFRIFNRWGEMVFEKTNFEIDSHALLKPRGHAMPGPKSFHLFPKSVVPGVHRSKHGPEGGRTPPVKESKHSLHTMSPSMRRREIQRSARTFVLS